MMNSAEIIAIIFRIINFGVIVALIAYLFKTRVLPFILNKIKDRIAESQALTEEQETLNKRYQQLLQELAADERAAIILKNHVDKWAQVVEQETHEHQMQKERQREYVQKQIDRREFERVRLKTFDVVTREAIKEVEKNMENKLSDEKKSQEYFTHLISSLASREK